MASILATTALAALFLLTSQAAVNGPVIGSDFPDPSILQVGGMSYAFSTNSGGKNIPFATSTDNGQTWLISESDALPEIGSWATVGKTWAPDVVDRGDGTFVMYYTAHSVSPDTQCVGVATATNPAGPYTPQNAPLACPASEGGAIDPAGFTDDDGSRWVVYKIDGNSLGGGGPCGNADGSHQTPIKLQRLAGDGITPVGDPTTILDRSPADGPLIEAPSLIKRGGFYVVFFSSNCFNTDLYDISYATASSITGPYTKATAPLLVTGNAGLHAPGGADPVRDGSTMVFHATLGSAREMFTANLNWDGTVATV